MLGNLGAIDPSISRLAASTGALENIKGALHTKKLAEIENTSKDFEAMFLNEMLSHMFSTTGTDPLFGGGESEEIWRDMMVEEYSKQIVSNGGVGLSSAIKAQMIAMQEAESQ